MPLREHVHFAGGGARLAGHLFLPDPAGGGGGSLSGVVVAGT